MKECSYIPTSRFVIMSGSKSRETRRQEILKAARRLFSEKGYRATTMDDITHASGLTKGGIYWHFNAKWEIFMAIFREHIRQHLALWQKVERIGIKPDALVEGGLLFIEEHLNNDWLANVCNEVEIESIRHPEIGAEYLAMYREIEEKVEDMLKRGKQQGLLRDLDYGSLALILIVLVEGILSRYFLAGKKLDYRRIWRTASEVMLRGIIKE